MAEEVFFRRFLQRTLQNLLPKQQILAVIIASLIFGITYFQGRLIYSFKHYMRFFLWFCI
ncbi:CPBP family glutamic-type intramembrane protease [Rickettsia conorii]|uniref:CPBP family glutamic-type intramembrane protease n=1 Tax=Rickettsia conorii TaxID=781 RepID=UPI002260C938|nr:CPBP family glutamic-type intramembrane protease [Rickettsia conorii]UZW39084.1 CPBP family glutamic-type intramembrane protease [Rickettsia conorii subsp. heilongjiangensis]